MQSATYTAWSAVTILALSAAVTIDSARAEDALVGRGKAILEGNCSRCHAVGVTGDSPLAMAPPFRTLSRKYPIDSLAEALAEGIVTGHNAMPHFVFTPEEISAILTYLNSINTH